MPSSRYELSDEDRAALRWLPRYTTACVAEGETFFNCDGAKTLEDARRHAKAWIRQCHFTTTWGVFVFELKPVLMVRGQGPGEFSETDLEGE